MSVRPKQIWYDKKNSYTMCFPNSAYLLVQTNLVNFVSGLNQEVLTIDNIANYSGYSRNLGVSVTEGRLQRISNKVNEALSSMGHSFIEAHLSLQVEPDLRELNNRLDNGEIILMAFSTGIYNRYFASKGIDRPCIASLESTGLDFSPPHYVSIFGVDKEKLAVLDPFCRYRAQGKPMGFAEFYTNNIDTITTARRHDFCEEILFNNRMDGMDFDNRQLIYMDIALTSQVKKIPPKKSVARADASKIRALDSFVGIDQVDG